MIGSCIIHPARIDEVVSFLAPEHFYSEAHRRIFEAIVSVCEKKAPVDVVTVATRLRETDRLAQVGGMPYLIDIMNVSPDVSRAETYGRTVFDLYRVRTLIETCQRVAADGYYGFGDPQDFIEQAEQSVTALARLAPKSVVETNLVAIKRVIQMIADAQKRAQEDGVGTGVSGIATGFPSYDKITAGQHGSLFTIIAARPGLGKTSLALQIAYNVAKQGFAVPFFSLEMSKDELLYRLLSQVSNVDSGLMRGGGMTRTHWTAITDAAKDIAALPLLIDDTASLNVRHIAARVRKHIESRKSGEPPVGLVVVDYVQFVAPVPELAKSFPKDQIAYSTKGLKNLAKETRLPVIALAALNRDVEKSGKVRRPRKSDIRDCGNIESDADVIAFLHRDAEVTKDGVEVYQENRPTELILDKQRAGVGTGTVNLIFDGPRTKFHDNGMANA